MTVHLVFVGFLGLFTIITGVIAIVTAARGSCRFPYAIGASIAVIILSFVGVWLYYEIGVSSYNATLAYSGVQDDMNIAKDLSIHHIMRAHIVIVGMIGIFLSWVALLCKTK